MNLVDSSGWLEYFANGVNVDFARIEGVKYVAKKHRR